MTRKIIVTGCVICPYLELLNDGNGNITNCSCKHPVFDKQLGKPKFPKDIVIDEDGIRTIKFPNFCPLPIDSELRL